MLRDYKKNLLIKFIFQQFMHYIENNFIIEIHEKNFISRFVPL